MDKKNKLKELLEEASKAWQLYQQLLGKIALLREQIEEENGK